MIAPRRRLHRRMILMLGLTVPLGFALAIGARPEFPAQVFRTGGATMGGPAAAPDLLETEVAGIPVAVRVGREFSEIEVAPAADPAWPDVLVYLVPASAPGAEEGGVGVPDGSLLLGTLAGAQPRRFPLAGEVPEGDLLLLFYSLAHQERMGRVSLSNTAALNQGEER